MATIGVDVSHYQGTIDWVKVASQVSFAYAKATDGLHSPDAYFHTNWQRIKDAGLPRGAYHFFRADMDAQAQADTFLATLGTLSDGDLAPMLDVEGAYGCNTQTIVTGATTWLRAVESVTGRHPIFYTRASFWNGLGDPADFASYPLWVAQYPWDTSPPAAPHIEITRIPTFEPKRPNAWPKYTIWQYTAQGKLAGIAGSVDFDLLAPGIAVTDLLGKPPADGTGGLAMNNPQG